MPASAMSSCTLRPKATAVASSQPCASAVPHGYATTVRAISESLAGSSLKIARRTPDGPSATGLGGMAYFPLLQNSDASPRTVPSNPPTPVPPSTAPFMSSKTSMFTQLASSRSSICATSCATVARPARTSGIVTALAPAFGFGSSLNGAAARSGFAGAHRIAAGSSATTFAAARSAFSPG